MVSVSQCEDNTICDFDLNVESIVLQNSEYIKAYISSRLFSKQDADDVYQAVMLEALRSKARFKSKSHPKYWLAGIANNLIKNKSRQASMKAVGYEEYEREYQESAEEKYGVEDPAIIFERENKLELIELAYNGLPEELKLLLQAVVIEGGSYSRAALDFGIPIGTVRSRIARARRLIKNKLYVGMH